MITLFYTQPMITLRLFCFSRFLSQKKKRFKQTVCVIVQKLQQYNFNIIVDMKNL